MQLYFNASSSGRRVSLVSIARSPGIAKTRDMSLVNIAKTRDMSLVNIAKTRDMSLVNIAKSRDMSYVYIQTCFYL